MYRFFLKYLRFHVQTMYIVLMNITTFREKLKEAFDRADDGEFVQIERNGVTYFLIAEAKPNEKKLPPGIGLAIGKVHPDMEKLLQGSAGKAVPVNVEPEETGDPHCKQHAEYVSTCQACRHIYAENA